MDNNPVDSSDDDYDDNTDLEYDDELCRENPEDLGKQQSAPDHPKKNKRDMKSPLSAQTHMKKYSKQMGVTYSIVQSKNTPSSETKKEAFLKKLESAKYDLPSTLSQSSQSVMKSDNKSSNVTAPKKKESVHVKNSNNTGTKEVEDPDGTSKSKTSPPLDEEDDTNKPLCGYSLVADEEFDKIYNGIIISYQ